MRILWIIGSWLIGWSAVAQMVKDVPLEIEADKYVRFDEKDMTVTAAGNCRILYGPYTLTSQEVRGTLRKGRAQEMTLEKLHAYGGRACVQEGKNKVCASDLFADLQDAGKLGNPLKTVRAHGKAEAFFDGRHAQAREIIYHPSTETIELKGNVVMTEGPQVIVGEYAKWNKTTGVSEVRSAETAENAAGKRVKLILKLR